MTPETFPAKYREAYDRLSPDGPEHFGVVLEKVHGMWLKEPQVTADDLRRVEAPVLVMAGDRDLIRLAPPLVIDAADLDWGIEQIVATVRDARPQVARNASSPTRAKNCG